MLDANTLITTAGLKMLIMAAFAYVVDLLQSQNFPFFAVFTFRYLRLIVHMISFWLYKPTPVAEHPRITPSDCTVILPIADPKCDDPLFKHCIETVLANNPAKVIISTIGRANAATCQRIVAPLNRVNSDKIRIIQQNRANKRVQVCHAMPFVNTEIVVTVDATAFWPSDKFLPALLAPFEDPKVGVVGTYKRVVREPCGFSFESFWNLIGCLYLERHNFEVTATNNIDGGVFVISGRTAGYRAKIFADPEFQQGFINERFFFDMFGPLNPDDDNFITRWVVRRGWKVKFQNSKDAMMRTRVGTYPKYLSQCLRWVRTTWRSNTATLFTDPFRKDCCQTVWLSQPWCVYAVFITSFFNFALFYDVLLMYLVSTTTSAETYGKSSVLKCMTAWIFASKLVKPFPHFRRNPADLIFLPGYILFGYYHSLVKLWALVTFWDCAWCGRVVKDADCGEVGNESDVDDNDSDDHSPGRYRHQLPDSGRNTDDRFNIKPYGIRGGSPVGIQTPWGVVKTSSPQTIAANVLECQIPGHSGKTRGRRGLNVTHFSSSGSSGGCSLSNLSTESDMGRSSNSSCPSELNEHLNPAAPITPSTKPSPRNFLTWVRGSCHRLHSPECYTISADQYCLLEGSSGYQGSSRHH